jgi:hypothetical protein
MAKENSHFINYIREWHRNKYNNVIKHIPEEMEDGSYTLVNIM